MRKHYDFSNARRGAVVPAADSKTCSTDRLAVFWVKRFLLILVIACAGLGIAEYFRRAAGDYSVAGVIGWSVATAVFAATVATWQAWKRQCKMVSRDDNGEH